jgi:endoglucanase
VLAPDTHFYVLPATLTGTVAVSGTGGPIVNDALQQAAVDTANGDSTDAAQMQALGSYSEAIWFTGGTATQSQADINTATQHNLAIILAAAAAAKQVPVFVIYDVPGRDCSQYSAGGAQSDAAYQSYINAFAQTLGSSKAVLVIEPDALSNLPDDCFGTSMTEEQASSARILDVKYAATTLESSDPNDLVYLDSGNPGWHGVGDYGSFNTNPNDPNSSTYYTFDGASTRLLMAGVNSVQGFSENVSNFYSQTDTTAYGNWVSQCVAFINNGGNSTWCPGQYDANGTDYSAARIAANDSWYATDGVPTAAPRPHFVVDSSRNGQGNWAGPTGKTIDGLAIGDPQVWCNPPGRGLGVRPTQHTGDPLLDAELWIKTEGESDGQCNRNQPSTNPYPASDPVYDQLFATPDFVDPAAGVFWPDYASTLVANAVPALKPAS